MIWNIIIPIMAMAGIGLVFGIGLACALKFFKIEIDPAIFKILSRLPGTNCGACGKAGCAGFAEALKEAKAIPSSCVLSTEEARKSIAEILGIEHNPKVKTIATLLCNGGVRARDKYVYSGIKSCKADALLFDGHKSCSVACLGLGDCVRSCPFNAITMGEDGLPVIDAAKCTACGKCVEDCPKNIIALTPVKNSYYVKCSSKDPGSVTAKVCKSGCIACRKCEKVCPAEAIRVEENLSGINHDKCQNIGKCFEVCPTKVIARR